KLRDAVSLIGGPASLQGREGWFAETLPGSPNDVGPVALLHCDCDWYESVMLTLETFYRIVVPGGYIVIDDFGACPGARRAVREFRARVEDMSRLVRVDQTGRYWRKPGRATS